MRASTNIIPALFIALSAVAGISTAGPAAAQASNDVPDAARDQVQVGTGVICDTQDEVAHFVKLIGEHDPRGAMIAVNREVSNPAACGMATVAFRTGKKIGEVRTTKGAFAVMEIEILAGSVNGNWQLIRPSRTQYTAVEVQGLNI